MYVGDLVLQGARNLWCQRLVLCAIFGKFNSPPPPFSPLLPSGVHFSDQNRH